MKAALQLTTTQTLNMLNENQDYLQPVPPGCVKSVRHIKTKYTPSSPSFLFNEKGDVMEQLLHMDQVWRSAFFEDLMGNLSLFVSFPCSTKKSERYQLNIVKGSNIANRLMNIATTDTELCAMKKLFEDAELLWDENETIIDHRMSLESLLSSIVAHLSCWVQKTRASQR